MSLSMASGDAEESWTDRTCGRLREVKYLPGVFSAFVRALPHPREI